MVQIECHNLGFVQKLGEIYDPRDISAFTAVKHRVIAVHNGNGCRNNIHGKDGTKKPAAGKQIEAKGQTPAT